MAASGAEAGADFRRSRTRAQQTGAKSTLWRWGVTFHVLDVSHETPYVTPSRTSPPMPLFVHASRETPDVTPCHTSPPQGVKPLKGFSQIYRCFLFWAGLHRFSPVSLFVSFTGLSSFSTGFSVCPRIVRPRLLGADNLLTVINTCCYIYE